jgi:hypothetical protein
VREDTKQARTRAMCPGRRVAADAALCGASQARRACAHGGSPHPGPAGDHADGRGGAAGRGGVAGGAHRGGRGAGGAARRRWDGMVGIGLEGPPCSGVGAAVLGRRVRGGPHLHMQAVCVHAPVRSHASACRHPPKRCPPPSTGASRRPPCAAPPPPPTHSSGAPPRCTKAPTRGCASWRRGPTRLRHQRRTPPRSRLARRRRGRGRAAAGWRFWG